MGASSPRLLPCRARCWGGVRRAGRTLRECRVVSGGPTGDVRHTEGASSTVTVICGFAVLASGRQQSSREKYCRGIRQTRVHILFTCPLRLSLSLANLPTPTSSFRSGVTSSRKSSSSPQAPGAHASSGLRHLPVLPPVTAGAPCPSRLTFLGGELWEAEPVGLVTTATQHLAQHEAHSRCSVPAGQVNTSSKRTVVLRSGDLASGPDRV